MLIVFKAIPSNSAELAESQSHLQLNRWWYGSSIAYRVLLISLSRFCVANGALAKREMPVTEEAEDDRPSRQDSPADVGRG